MGLSEPRKRRKIGNDPNNTSWTRDETSYGHKILSSQGWAPGDTLGAADASHSSHYTVGSTSHIKVLLKEDNLGLGAKRGKQQDNIGLAQLADIYGRLNGKSDAQIKKDQDARQDLVSKLYVQQKFGKMPFVRGGFLVGDRIEDGVPYEIKQEPFIKAEDETKVETIVKEEDLSDSRPKRSRKEKRRKTCQQLEGNEVEGAPAIKQEPTDDVTTSQTMIKKEESEDDIGRSHRKEQRRKEKIQRRAAKEAKRARKEARKLQEEQTESASSRSSTTALTTPTELPAHPVVTSNPFNVRQRFIKQKRMAMMDPQALREILMQKA